MIAGSQPPRSRSSRCSTSSSTSRARTTARCGYKPALVSSHICSPAFSLSDHHRTGSLESSNAFISPQWGGVVIHSPSSTAQSLSSAFSLFTHQLHALLGVPISPTNSPRLEQWQVDAMVRRRLGEAATEAVETLHSIVKLVDQIPNMRVGETVQKGVRSALAELDAVRPPSLGLRSQALTLRRRPNAPSPPRRT